MAQFDFLVAASANSVGGGTGLATGISVAPGDLLTINASPEDLWLAGPGNRTSNANGLGNPFGGQFSTLNHNGFSFLYGSLIGSLDGGRTFFPVGTRLEMTVLAPGTLSLYYWDLNSADNFGNVAVTVVVYRGPVY
jgi:hypothetical protein